MGKSKANSEGRAHRLLIFAPACAPFANPEAIVNSKLALNFLAQGFDVQIIGRNLAEESSYDFGSRWEEPWLPLKNRTHLVQYRKGTYLTNLGDSLVSAVRMGHPIDGFRWASHALKLALELHKGDPFDIVLSRSGPDAAHMPALHFVRRTGKPWLANWNDPCFARMPPPYSGNVNSRINFFGRRFYGIVGRHAIFHTFPCERLKQYINRYLPSGSLEKSRVIPHVMLKQTAQAVSRKNQEMIFCHTGRLDKARSPNTFLMALKSFCDSSRIKKNITIRFVGLLDPSVMETITKFSHELHIEFVGATGYQNTLTHVANSDVAVLIEAPCEEGIFLPSKFVDYVQTGRPILAISPKDGTIRDFIDKHGGGVAVDCRDVRAIQNSISELYQAWSSGSLESSFDSVRLQTLFSPDSVLSKYTELFKTALS